MAIKKVVSSLPALTPVAVWSAKTGEEVTKEIWSNAVESLLNYVRDETQAMHERDDNRIYALFEEANNRVGFVNSFADKRGYASSYKTLPAEVKAKSRLNELILHKFVSETLAYHQNQNPRKQPPTFYPKIELGAADKQMSHLAREGNTLYLSWKVWTEELVFEFTVPDYVMKRDVTKWSLPRVQKSKKTGEPIFTFTIQETPQLIAPGKVTAGVDLGRIEPFTLAIINEGTGQTLKSYRAHGRLKRLNQKRENVLKERTSTLAKAIQYKKLGLDAALLEQEAARLKSKARKLGNALAPQLAADLHSKLEKHSVTLLRLENLSWVHGKKYGGRWNHSTQQQAITHREDRAGRTVKKTNPAGSSQHCHQCGKPITHSPKIRKTRCDHCRLTLDRDFNAALNIAKNKSYPRLHRVARGNYSSPEQVTNESSRTLDTAPS